MKYKIKEYTFDDGRVCGIKHSTKDLFSGILLLGVVLI